MNIDTGKNNRYIKSQLKPLKFIIILCALFSLFIINCSDELANFSIDE